MDRPLISVVMPAYNAERFIRFAIESVLQQTMQDFELIIIDDGSVDGTVSVIKDLSADPRVVFFQNEGNKGISYTTNRAISISRGKYIALLDDDDEAFMNRLELQVDFLEQDEAYDILGGRTRYIDASGNTISEDHPRYNPRYIKSMLLLKHEDFSNGTIMIRKEFLDRYNLRYTENMMGMQDYRFLIEASKLGSITTIDELLLKHRIHDNNETDRQKQNEDRKRLYAALQRYSLEKSGYMLDDQEYKLLSSVIKESSNTCESRLQFLSFYDILLKLMNQARDMNVDYLKELEAFLKNIIKATVFL